MPVKICTAGDNVVDRYLDYREMFPGGNAVNVAVHSRRLGATSAYIGAIGTDEAGRLIANSLRSEDVKTERMRIVEGANAWAALKHINGDRIFVAQDKGISRFILNDEDLDYFSDFDLVHIGYAGGLEGQIREVALHAPVSFDFADKPRKYAESLLPHVTYATFSVGEEGLDQADDLIDWAHSFGAKTVLLTAGASGAVVSDGNGRDHVAAAPVNVVDTLGAGDAYIAAFLVESLNGVPRKEAMSTASIYAADVCRQLGAFGYRTADVLALSEI